MDQNQALISVIIPTYYRNDSLKNAIDSVIESSYHNIEIVVVDDSGEGYAESAIESYSDIHYINLESNVGANRARSKGISQSSGKYIQLLDDDDQIKPDSFEKRIDIVQSSSNVGVAYCGQEYSSGKIILPEKGAKGDVLDLALADELKPCVTSTLLVERNILEDVLPLPDTPGSDDIYIKIELARSTRFDFINEPLILRGETENSRESGENAIIGMERVLTTYAGLYERHPNSVRKRLLGNLYHRKGNHRLWEKGYSFVSIYWFILAVFHYPNLNFKYIGTLFASFFGVHGVTASRTVYNQIKGTSTE